MENNEKIAENTQNPSKNDTKTTPSGDKNTPPSLGTLQNTTRSEDKEKGYKLNKTKFRDALPGTGGIISAIAKKLNVARSTVYTYIEKHPDLQAEVADEGEKILDVAENKLYDKVTQGDWKAIEFILSRKGKKRGYTEKIEQDVTNRDFNWERFQHILHDESEDDVKDEDNKGTVEKEGHQGSVPADVPERQSSPGTDANASKANKNNLPERA